MERVIYKERGRKDNYNGRSVLLHLLVALGMRKEGGFEQIDPQLLDGWQVAFLYP